MTPTGPRDEHRALKPGDLYLVTGDAVRRYWHQPEGMGEAPYRVIETFMNVPLKLVCRHPCGALEFLVMGASEGLES